MRTPLLLAILASITVPASADLFIYEPFDYPDTGPLNDLSYFGDGTQTGALGTTGAWSELSNADNADGSPTNGFDVRAVGLTFTDVGGNELPVTGGLVTRDNRVGQSAASIAVESSATTGLTADNTTMWMAFLFQDKGFSGPDSGIALATDTMVASDTQALNSPGFGVGVGVNSVGGTLRAIGTIVFNNATGQTFTPEAVATFDGPGNSPVHLLAMKVNWNASGTPDEIFVFDITDITTEPDESAALASNTFDWTQEQQNSLNVLTIGESQVENWDEIRIGTSFGDVVGSGPPESFAIVEFVYAEADEMVTLTWNSREGASYAVRVATDLTDWEADLDDSVIGDLGETTTRTFDVAGLAANGKLYFRVERN